MSKSTFEPIRDALIEVITNMITQEGLDLSNEDTRDQVICSLNDAIAFFDNFEFGTEIEE
jgi:hypothetical protein